MWKKIILISTVFFLISCEKEDDVFLNPIPVPNTKVLLYRGPFVPTSGISVTGKASIYREKKENKVILEDFSVSEGPNLKVYLSKTDTPVDFISLGDLTSETVYPIPSEVDLKVYKYVLIHCQQYNHLFAVASLQ